MNDLHIKGSIRPAHIYELISNNGCGAVFPYQQVFVKSLSGDIKGPYYMSEYNDYIEIMMGLSEKVFYVYDNLIKDSNYFEFSLHLRPATDYENMIDKCSLSVVPGWTYFFLSQDGGFSGPYTTSSKNNYETFRKRLAQERIYIMKRNQHIDDIKPIKINL